MKPTSAGTRATHAFAFVDGFSCGLRALLGKEVRARSRGWRPVAVLTGYLLGLAAVVAGFLALAAKSVIGASPSLGLQLFSMLAFGAVVLLAFITVSVTVGTISGERERRTLDLLLVTRASALGLVAGKLSGSLLYVLFLLVASVPAFALVYLFGGVPPRYVVLVFVIASATAVAHASLGLLLSALLRRTIVASVVAYVVVLGLVFGLPFAATIAGANDMRSGSAGWVGANVSVVGRLAPTYGAYGSYTMYRGSPVMESGAPPRRYTYASPLVALTSVLPTGAGAASGLPLLDIVMQVVVGSTLTAGGSGTGLLRTTYVTGVDAATGEMDIAEAWSPWLYYVGGSLATVPLALLLAASAISPPRRRSASPWHRWLRSSARGR